MASLRCHGVAAWTLLVATHSTPVRWATSARTSLRARRTGSPWSHNSTSTRSRPNASTNRSSSRRVAPSADGRPLAAAGECPRAAATTAARRKLNCGALFSPARSWPARRAHRSSRSPMWPTVWPATRWALTGCRKGAVPSALVADGPPAARRELSSGWSTRSAVTTCGRVVGPRRPARLGPRRRSRRRRPPDRRRPRRHQQRPLRHAVATQAGHRRRCRPGPSQPRRVDPWLPAAAGAHLRSGAEQARRFARYPGVVERAAEVGRAAAFDLSLVAPNLPPFPCPPGPNGTPLTEMQYLRQITEKGGPPVRRASRPRRGPVAARLPGRGARSITSST